MTRAWEVTKRMWKLTRQVAPALNWLGRGLARLALSAAGATGVPLDFNKTPAGLEPYSKDNSYLDSCVQRAQRPAGPFCIESRTDRILEIAHLSCRSYQYFGTLDC